MRIDEFKSNFKIGARPTLYRLEVQGLPEKLRFVCKIAQLPGRTINIIEVPYAGQTVKLAGDNTFEDLTITFSVDTDFSVKTEIEQWMEMIRESNSSVGTTPAEYKRTGDIIQLDENDDEIAQYKFYGMWPTSLDPVELGFDQKDTIMEQSCTFSIDYWDRIN